MMIEELQQYIRMVEEEWQCDQLLEMARVGEIRHGIPKVVIWVGLAPKQHGLRVKVSNIPNKMDPSDNFTVQIPSLDYDPNQVAKWIDTKTMGQILDWIKLNQQLLYDYETGEIDDTDKFVNSIAKV